MTATTKRGRRPRRDGYSIAAILLLMATIGVMLGMARSLFASSRISDTSGINMVFGFLGGVVIGGMLGMSHERRFNGMLVGVLVGAISGVAGGALTGGRQFDLTVILLGSVAILVFGCVVHAASRSRASVHGDDTGAPPGGIARLLQQMTPRHMLALVLVLATGTYAAVKSYELVRDRSYSTIQSAVGQATLILVLLALTLWLARLVLRRPTVVEKPTELSAIDILDDPPAGA